MAEGTVNVCSEHNKEIIYTVAGFFNHTLRTLYREDEDETIDGGWCEDCKAEAETHAKQQGGCMSYLPLQGDVEDEWEDGTDLITIGGGSFTDVLVCKCGYLQKHRVRREAAPIIKRPGW